MKNKTTAILLTFFLGGLGVHKFYLGQTGLGIAYLLFCWTLIPGLIAFIEFILFILMSDADFDAKYN
jgi:TM2 domain-containing membrane protein YozV